MINIKSFVFGPFYENTYLLYDETKDCIVIDPGCYSSTEKQELKDFINQNDLNVVGLYNTHCHIDHVTGNAFIKNEYKVKLFAHVIEVPYLKSVESYAQNYGIMHFEPSVIDEYIDEGDMIKFGNAHLEMLFVPGHSPGHLAFYNTDEKFIIGGDVLFNQSIGRTDLPGGNFETLINSIHEKFFNLEDGFIVYSGHGPTTSIGAEKKTNPFCAISSSN